MTRRHFERVAMFAQFPSAEVLVGLFYENVSQLGELIRVGQLEAPYDALLHHQQHMTIAVERYYQGPVDVDVLDVRLSEGTYSRKILLRRKANRAVVQFGIVRLRTRFLSEQVRHSVESRQVPLGRVLIEHDVMRQVELVQLWKVDPAAELAGYFESKESTFGRSALIYVGDSPAIELLEILAPVRLAGGADAVVSV